MPHKRPFTADQTKLFAKLITLGIQGKTYFHPRLHTVDESREWAGIIVGGQCKNLFLKDKKGNFALIVALQNTQIKLNHLHKRINMARLSFGNPEKLYEMLKIRPGSVTPYALINITDQPIRIFLDKNMMNCEILNFHPLENWATTAIRPDELQKFIHSCGLEFETIDFSEVPTE